MKTSHGPWSTAMHAGNNPQLSTFWKRRLTMLAPTRESKPVLTNRMFWCLLVTACLACATPTFRDAPIRAEEGNSQIDTDRRSQTVQESVTNDHKQKDVEAKIRTDEETAAAKQKLAKKHRAQCQNNLNNLGQAMLNYYAVHDQFPTANITGPDGKTFHSWRVALLPYLGEPDLYKQYNFIEPWDSPSNREVLKEKPSVFHCPADRTESDNTSYFVLTGARTVFSGTEGATIGAGIPDGVSNTISIVEAKRKIPWTKPIDIPYDDAKPLPKLGGFHQGGFNAGFPDTTAWFISDRTDEKMLRQLIRKDDLVFDRKMARFLMDCTF